MEAIQYWVSEHKLTSIGIGASLACSCTRSPLKPSLRLIHARMHLQALTLVVLFGAAAYHYYGKRTMQRILLQSDRREILDIISHPSISTQPIARPFILGTPHALK